MKRNGWVKLVLAALQAEVCLAMLGESFDVYAATNASGRGLCGDARNCPGRQAHVVPITWLAVASEWQRDRAREASLPGFAEAL